MQTEPMISAERREQFKVLLAGMNDAELDALHRRLMKLRNTPEPTGRTPGTLARLVRHPFKGRA